MGVPETIYAKAYGDMITLLAQQQGSLILKASAVTVKRNVVGEEVYMDQIASEELDTVVGRLQQYTLANPNYSRRRISKYNFSKAYALDKFDLQATIPDPTSPVVQTLSNAAGRQYDNRILIASRGTAYTGQEGGTSVALPAAQKVAAGGTGLTIAKLRSAKKILDQGKLPKDGRFIGVDAEGMEDLLTTTEVTSSDFNTVKALVQGDLDTFLGFKFINLEAPISDDAASTLGSSGASYAVAWHKSSLGIAIWGDSGASIDTRVDVVGKPKQLSYDLSIGSSRLQEAGVVEIAFV